MWSFFKTKRFLGLKKIFVLLAFVILFFLCYSTYLNVKFAKDMNYDKTLGKAKYISEENGYIFKYKNAYPWNFKCFASVCTEESMKVYVDEKGNMQTNGMTLVLYIWPEMNGYRYGLDMYQEGEESIDLQLYIDDKLKIVSAGNKEYLDEETKVGAEVLIEKNQKDIKKLMEVAKEKWNIK